MPVCYKKSSVLDCAATVIRKCRIHLHFIIGLTLFDVADVIVINATMHLHFSFSLCLGLKPRQAYTSVDYMAELS